MLNNYFNNEEYIREVCDNCNISYNDIIKIYDKYKNYASQAYTIPFTVWIEPEPYQQPRVNKYTKTIYVPEKKKMVERIRDGIMKDLGPDNFINGFFPRYEETIIKTNLYLKTPDSFSKEAKYLSEMKVLRPIITPDVDNVEKVFNDAIKSFIIYDDAQIVGNITEKYYSIHPRMEFLVICNINTISSIHKDIMKKRNEKWKMMSQIEMEKQLTPIQLHLKRYFNTI